VKPSIVFSHGIWADGSCFQKLIPTLRAEGHQVIAAQYGLDTVKGDVDATIRSFGRVSGPIVLVGHSYGGTVITHAGTDKRVAALVYISALGPDETETSQGQQDKFPKTDVFKHIEVADGRVWMKASHGGRSQVGPSWPPRTAPCILILNASPRSAWAPRPWRLRPAMSPCSRTPRPCSM
jgi:pimeloyl-ACP methyl ester carboxylesterase